MLLGEEKEEEEQKQTAGRKVVVLHVLANRVFKVLISHLCQIYTSIKEGLNVALKLPEYGT